MTTTADERPGCLARIFALFGIGTNRAKSEYNYRLKDNFLSKAELSFYHVLQKVTPTDTVILTKVNLGDLFYVLNAAPSPRAQRNKIDRKHVDFLLCDAKTMQPIAGIELDDNSHKRQDRVLRDAFVEQVFQTANLKLLRFPVKQGYQPNEVGAQLQQVTGLARASVQPSTKMSTANSAPTCPKCGSPMVIRTSSNGQYAGQQFYGCSNYPQCRGMVRLST